VLDRARSTLEGVTLPKGVVERPFLAAVDIRLDPRDTGLVARVGSALGVDLPMTANTVNGDAEQRHVLWLGPDEWLVVDAPGSAPAIESVIQAASGDAFVTTVDVSATRTALELSGPGARELLESGTPIDLHPRAFGPGRCAGTVQARNTVLIHQLTDEPRYRIWVRPSFARYLAVWLLESEVGLT
jgi:sarcosine oxidase subunit gamma